MSNESKPLWGGFSESMHPALARISESIQQDLPLADADLRASAVYAQALAKAGVLTEEEAKALSETLEALRQELNSGAWRPADAEDVHTAIEAEVTRRVPAGGKLHTGRSRNDQVSTAFRLALAERLEAIEEAVRQLQSALVVRAEQEIDTLMPSYTHLQRAQPIRLAHWLLGYFWPLQRDVERLQQVRQRVLQLPLGVGAVSGNPFGLDREWMAEALGFEGVTENSLDTVGDRDFAVESVFACSMIALHLSRLSEELVVWSSAEFGYIRWPDALATGSSLMPNKKNPDLPELVRGRAASAVGDLTSLLVLIKGLPSSYQRDLQEDKPPVWRQTQTVLTSLLAMAAAMQGISFVPETMRAALSDDVLATELADVLVERGLPFRQAHHVVAQVAAQAREHSIGFKAVATHEACQLPEPLKPDDVLNLDVVTAIDRRNIIGGTGKSAVRTQLMQAKAALDMAPTSAQ